MCSRKAAKAQRKADFSLRKLCRRPAGTRWKLAGGLRHRLISSVSLRDFWIYTQPLLSKSHRSRALRRSASTARVLFATFFAVAAHAQDIERIAPKQPPPAQTQSPTPAQQAAEPVGDETPLIENLRALVFLTPDENATMAVEKEARGIIAPGLPLLQTPAARVRLGRYIGAPLSLRKLGEIQRDVIAIYRANDRPVGDAS